MQAFEIQRSIKAHANVVWEVLTDHQSFAEISPDITRLESLSGEKLGLVNRFHHKSGKVWDEQCTEWHENRSYTMAVISRDYVLPVSGMKRSCSMEERQKDTLIRLRYEYLPKYGPLGGLLNKYQILPVLKMYSHALMDNLIGKIHHREWGSFVTAATILKGKGADTLSVSPDARVMDMIGLLTARCIGSVVVLDANRRIVGIVSERDVVHELAEHGPGVLEQSVATVMTKGVITCRPDDNLQKLMTCMTDRRVRHLPVVDGSELVGIVSIGDIVKARMDELEHESGALENYIRNRRWQQHALQVGRQQASDEADGLADASRGRS